MNEFDKLIKENLKEENDDIPNSVKMKIEETLCALPEKEPIQYRPKVYPKVACIAFFFLFASLVIMPNCNVAYAQALENVPIIGKFVKVVTIRNYFYSDQNHEMNIDVPNIENEHNNEAVDYINKDVSELTQIIVDRFYEELEASDGKGHSSIYADYDVVTNCDDWFTLKITVLEIAGSSNTYYKYYHIDKTNGKIVQLDDLARSSEFYNIIESEIRKQMQEQMDADENIVYWIDNSEFGWDFVKLSPNHNFYWNDDGNLVIVFDKYEVGPGSIGTPEFVIDISLIKDVL